MEKNSIMDVKKCIYNIRKNGISVIPNLISKKDCDFYKKKSLKLIEMYKRLKRPLSAHNQVINSPFRHEHCFYKLIYNIKLDKILQKLIDKNYVLINTNILNRAIDKDINVTRRTIGDDWHTDTPEVGGTKTLNGFRFLVTIMLDDFTEKNGCTLYIPKSHLNHKIPVRNKKYKCEKLIGKSGDVVIFDSSLWHKGGNPSIHTRLSIFSLYGPWWIKPYFNYEKMLGKNKLKKLNNKVRKLLHYNSKPPRSTEEREYTVTEY